MIELVADTFERLDKFLARSLPGHSRTRLAELASEGKVLVAGKSRSPSHKLQPGDRVSLEEPEEKQPHDLSPADIPLEIVFQDADLMVVNKPRGLATHPARSLKEPSLVNALLGLGAGIAGGAEAFRPGIVHRLDKETTGLIVIAKSEAAHAALSKQIAGRTVVRQYLAVVSGVPTQERFIVDAPIGRDPRQKTRMAVTQTGKVARTHVRVLRSEGDSSLILARLETGRTHQIRVHLAAVGHPVLGDDMYAQAALCRVPLQLHAAMLSFEHPRTGETLRFVVSPPSDFLIPVENLPEFLEAPA